MIKINLLPDEMTGANARGGAAGGGSDAGGSAMVAIILIIIFGIDILLGGFLFYKYNEASQRNATARTESAQIAAELKSTEVRFKEEKSSIERMEQLISVAQSLDPDDRLLWAKKLNALPLLIPEGVFLTEINVAREILEIETPESIRRRNEWEKGRQGPPPEVEKNPQITQILNLHGISYAEGGTQNERLEQIIAFIRSLEDNEVELPYQSEKVSFMENFVRPLQPSGVSPGEVEGREVSQFRLTVRSRPVVIRSTPDPAPATTATR